MSSEHSQIGEIIADGYCLTSPNMVYFKLEFLPIFRKQCRLKEHPYINLIPERTLTLMFYAKNVKLLEQEQFYFNLVGFKSQLH